MVNKNRKKQMKLYNLKNKEKIKLQKQEYYKKNKESILKKVKEYRENFLDKNEKKEYNKEYYQKNKKVLLKKNKLYRNKPEVKENIKAYDKRRQQTPERQKRDRERNQKPERKVWKRNYHREYQVNRRQTDESFRLIHNLRAHLCKAFKLYSTKGKMTSSKKYGIDWGKILTHLGPEPNDGNIYEKDHIVPLCMFDHDDPIQVKKAWAPENFQWLTREVNQWKGDRLIKPLTDDEKDKLQKKLVMSLQSNHKDL